VAIASPPEPSEQLALTEKPAAALPHDYKSRPMHLFEFMDLDGLPRSLRSTLREILECGNSQPFRPYYTWVADEVLARIQEHGIERVVELGAGTAPITRHLVSRVADDGSVKLVVCDRNPDRAAYEQLARCAPEVVEPVYEPVDFSRPRDWHDRPTLLVLSATLHHIPSEQRHEVLAALRDSADHVLIVEPLRRTLLSMAFVFGSLVPALLTPLVKWNKAGRLQRIFWCWLLPLAPLMFVWDGLVSCMRMWTRREWEAELESLLPPTQTRTIEHHRFTQLVGW